ncbi:jg21435 [Pararge aegeria aegeria]|uniref:Jg21435 protein n=1 Tax=Pararge aegeria aegeria TaxID=348720 RepID=A0A8S4RBD1_9NEOP|nr:jg21435 [Pararge aegeria aegeria]
MDNNGGHKFKTSAQAICVKYVTANLFSAHSLEEDKNKLSRRFNFAPAKLLGPLKENTPTVQNTVANLEGEVKIPWIKKWKHGILPYYIDPNTYDSLLADIILKAFDYVEKFTCIRLQRLREKPVDKQSLQTVEWLYITNPSGVRQCVHSNERKPNTGVQSDIKIGQREALSELDVEKIGMIYGRECVERNKDYLLKTCPSVVKIKSKPEGIQKKDIEEYFNNRIWPYGIVNYQIKDILEFTVEERENMKAVFDHIEKETCIEFRDITSKDDVDDNENILETTNGVSANEATVTSDTSVMIKAENFGDQNQTLNSSPGSIAMLISAAKQHCCNAVVRSEVRGCRCNNRQMRLNTYPSKLILMLQDMVLAYPVKFCLFIGDDFHLTSDGSLAWIVN